MNSLIYSHQDAKISIILGTYNRLKYLKKTIKSVRESNFDIPYEIIVVDGGSTDGTLRWLTHQKDIITIVQHNHGKIGVHNIQRRSWGYFMNLACKTSKGKYILMISDDCLVTKNAIINGYNYFEEKLKQGVNLGALAFYWRNWPDNDKYFVGTLFEGIILVNHGMYLKSAMEEVNFFEEKDLVFYYADSDMILKLVNNGYISDISPDSYVEHFAYANVKVRKKNRFLIHQQWTTYIDRWAKVYKGIDYYFKGGNIKKEWNDPDNTVKLFPKVSYINYYFAKTLEFIKPKVKQWLIKHDLYAKPVDYTNSEYYIDPDDYIDPERETD